MMADDYLLKLEIDAAGSVRRCAPYCSDSTCPACEAHTSPRIKVLGKTIGAVPHKVSAYDDTFVQRTCGHCGMQWLEFHTDETKE